MADVWDELVSTVQSEFSDVPDVAQLTRITLRLLLAALLGGVLGFEREHQGKAAGVRTHMLVSVGAALFVLVPQQAGVKPEDMSRVIQGLVAGVGFLGAGTIVKMTSAREVKGMTTAAGIWATAAIGMACGLGRESTAALSTLLILLILMAMPKVVRMMDGPDGTGETRADGDADDGAGGDGDDDDDYADDRRRRRGRR